MKNFCFCLLLCFINTSLFAKEFLNLYSARQEVLMRPLIQDFQNKTGIKINIVSAKADQLMQRLYREGELTPADLLLTTDAARLEKAKRLDLLQQVHSTILNKKIPSLYRDKSFFWYGLSLRVRVIIYNKDKISAEDLQGTGYINLADKKFHKNIFIRSSSCTCCTRSYTLTNCSRPISCYFLEILGCSHDACFCRKWSRRNYA